MVKLDRSAFRKEEFVFLLIIGHVMALRNLGLILVIPVLAVFASDLEGSTPFRVGLSIGIYGLTQALFQIPFGRASDRVGRRRMVVVGVLIFSAGNLLAGMSQHIHLLIAGRALMGAGAIAAVCFAWISDRIPPERRSQSFGIVTVLASVAGLLGFFMGPVLYRFLPLSYVFFGCAVVGLLAVPILVGFLPESLPAASRPLSHTSKSPPSLRETAADPYVLLHCGMGLLMNYFVTSLFFAIPYQLKGLIQPEMFWKIITPVIGVSLLVLVPATRWADKGRVRTVIQWGFVLECLAAVALLPSPTLLLLVLALFLFVLGCFLLIPSLPSSLSRGYDSSHYGAVMGLYSMFLFFGSFLGATLSGLLYSYGFVWIGISLIALSLAGGWMNLRLRKIPLPVPGGEPQMRTPLGTSEAAESEGNGATRTSLDGCISDRDLLESFLLQEDGAGIVRAHSKKEKRMKKVLLINPFFNPEVTKVQTAVLKFLSVKAFMVPLGVATVAALTPDDVEVDIWDEAIRGEFSDGTRFEKDYDLVGVTGYINHRGRGIEISRIVRSRGIPVAIGGPGVSSAPEYYRDHFDILFIGEAEYTWPRFIADFKSGSYRSEYRQVSKVDMGHSPLPRWDKVAADLKYYLVGSVQTTRGCPFDCEFCDVIYIFGRKPRHKSIEHVLEEVSTLERLGATSVFFCDDNFLGDPRYTKALLRELVTLNRSFVHPLEFSTQINLTVAKDDEMLELLADANFSGLFIGVETPNIESLIEANKHQNYRTDIVRDVKKIHGYGLGIQAGMIVGFDHDDATIFDHQFAFLQETSIPNPLINTLKAPIGTKLWIRLHKEGRVVERSILQSTTTTDEPLTNIIPKQMTRVELLSGYRGLVERVRDWRNFEARVKGMISQVRRRPNIKRRPVPLKRALKFFWHVFSSTDREARGVTLRLLLHTLRQMPWMTGKVGALIARQYVETTQLPAHLARIDEQIRLETAEGTKLERVPTVFFVPDAFTKPYKAIFPELYERVHQGLSDKSRTHDALVETIYDFLTRWSTGFEQFEEHHRTFLHEICDRTIAKENSNSEVGSGGEAAAEGVPDEMAGLTEKQVAARLGRLADEVLHFVEQEMRDFRTEAPASE